MLLSCVYIKVTFTLLLLSYLFSIAEKTEKWHKAHYALFKLFKRLHWWKVFNSICNAKKEDPVRTVADDDDDDDDDTMKAKNIGNVMMSW